MIALAQDIDPVRLTVAASSSAITITVAADPGALDPRAGPVRLQAKLARGECGGSFAFTSGTTVIDAALDPQPVAGAAYNASATGTPGAGPGTFTVCAFLDDDERQFTTDTDMAGTGACGSPPRSAEAASGGRSGTRRTHGGPPSLVRLCATQGLREPPLRHP